MVIDENLTRPTRDRSPLKSAFVRSLIASLAGTGLLGIGALLLGSFGELEARILLTTLLVGACSILCLAGLVVVGTKHGPVGVAGIVTASTALLLGVGLTWAVDVDSDWSLIEVLVKAFVICGVLAVALAHAALLFNAARGTTGSDRSVLAATLVALSIVAAMLCLLTLESDTGGAFWRMLGVFAILDVIGTVLVPLTARFGSASRR